MNKTLKGMLAAVLAIALALALFLGAGILRDWREIQAMTKELAESRARWEDTAARKEALQAELKQVTEALKEAKLTLEESTAREAELQADIQTLEQEIQALRNPEGISE